MHKLVDLYTIIIFQSQIGYIINLPSTRLSGTLSKFSLSLECATGLVLLLERKHEKQFPIDQQHHN